MAKNLQHVDAVALGEVLQGLRGDLSLNKAAKLIGSYPGNLRQWELGEIVPSIGSLYALARGYGVTLDSLIVHLVPDYRRHPSPRADQAVAELLETCLPADLDVEQVMDRLGTTVPLLFDPPDREAFAVAVVSEPMGPFLDGLVRAMRLERTSAVPALAQVVGELVASLPATALHQRSAYPPKARELLEDYDAALARASAVVAGDDADELLRLRIAVAGWIEAARVMAEGGAGPEDRRLAVLRTAGVLRTPGS